MDLTGCLEKKKRDKMLRFKTDIYETKTLITDVLVMNRSSPDGRSLVAGSCRITDCEDIFRPLGEVCPRSLRGLG